MWVDGLAAFEFAEIDESAAIECSSLYYSVLLCETITKSATKSSRDTCEVMLCSVFKTTKTSLSRTRRTDRRGGFLAASSADRAVVGAESAASGFIGMANSDEFMRLDVGRDRMERKHKSCRMAGVLKLMPK